MTREGPRTALNVYGRKFFFCLFCCEGGELTDVLPVSSSRLIRFHTAHLRVCALCFLDLFFSRTIGFWANHHGSGRTHRSIVRLRWREESYPTRQPIYRAFEIRLLYATLRLFLGRRRRSTALQGECLFSYSPRPESNSRSRWSPTCTTAHAVRLMKRVLLAAAVVFFVLCPRIR